MAKYINKDQAYKIVLHYGSYVASTKIADLPSIDLVLCGECKYHLPETERTNPYCNRFHCMKPDDWFCADGERKVQE